MAGTQAVSRTLDTIRITRALISTVFLSWVDAESTAGYPSAYGYVQYTVVVRIGQAELVMSAGGRSPLQSESESIPPPNIHGGARAVAPAGIVSLKRHELPLTVPIHIAYGQGQEWRG
jgi:hypothetical protein